jgi:hypothetical protein
MADTFRALCAELADRLDDALTYTVQSDTERSMRQLIARARAELAQREPQGVTDDELLELSAHHGVSYTMSSGEVVYPMQQGCGMRDDVLSFARAVLAHWGRPAIEPVPVSAGLPGSEDCDEEGRCWWWYPPRAGNAPTYGYWAHEDDATDRAHHEWPAAWLPHWALPVPGVEGA